MNRYRENTAYVFSPPKFSPFWSKIIYWVSDRMYLAGRHRIAEVKIAQGGDFVVESWEKGDSLLITPNHSDHSDPHVLLHLSRIYKIPIHFVAAREIFELNHGLNGKILQRAGVFSIDREGADLKAIKECMKILYDAKHPLVLFPEGEIYHSNERLTPLNDGAATIMLKIAKKIKKEKPGKNCYIVPTAMKYSYIDDVSRTSEAALDRLEKHILWQPQKQLGIVERIYKFGEAILGLKEIEYLNRTLDGSLTQRLEKFREILISGIEEKYFGKISEGLHPERVRRARGKIRTLILANEKPTAEQLRELYRDLDKLYFAIQLYSYPGQYLKEKPTHDRIAETILKLEEDMFEEYKIKGARKVDMHFCEPIDMAGYLEADSKESVDAITTTIETRIRDILER